MTNFEYYKEEILGLANTDTVGIAILTDTMKPVECAGCSCDNCYLHIKGGCSKALVRWLYSEHVEQPKTPTLTKKEKQFCELVDTGWIARDSDEQLYYFEEEPAKNKRHKRWEQVPFSKVIEMNQFDNCNFSFITWEDTDPYNIENLLKLEVE